MSSVVTCGNLLCRTTVKRMCMDRRHDAGICFRCRYFCLLLLVVPLLKDAGGTCVCNVEGSVSLLLLLLLLID